MVTEYYTGTNYRPVRSVASSSTTGHGTNVTGLAISLEATAIPALIIVAGILLTNHIAGLWNCYCCDNYACISRNGCCT